MVIKGQAGWWDYDSERGTIKLCSTGDHYSEMTYDEWQAAIAELPKIAGILRMEAAV